MKIFTSWSGTESHKAALALKEWFETLFSDIQLFVSSEDIRKGKSWHLEMRSELEGSDFGIVCLIPGNLEAPWVLFESGALSKKMKDASLWTLLFGGLKHSNVDGPLSHFQHTMFEKEDFFKLLKAINECRTSKHELTKLRKVFDQNWGELETDITKALVPSAKVVRKSNEEILDSLLELTNYIARHLHNPPKSIRLIPAMPLTSTWGNILMDLRSMGNEALLQYFATAELIEIGDDNYRLQLSDEHKAHYAEVAEALQALGYENVSVVANITGGPPPRRKPKE